MKILFIGELYPQVIHGVSISNYINLMILEKKFDIYKIEEKTFIDKISFLRFSKVVEILRCCVQLFYVSRRVDFHFLYLVASINVLGLVKTNLYVYFFLKRSRKIILHIHRSDFNDVYETKMKALLIAMLMRRIDGIICLTENQSIQLKNGLMKHKIKVYYLNNTILQEKKYLSIPIEKNSESQKSILFLSNFFQEKGVLEVIKVARRFPKINFNLAGDNEELLEKVELSKNVNILGPVFGDDKFKLFHESDLLLFPSWNEGQPLVLIEAMAAGLPIISTNVGFIPETLGHDYPFMVKPKEVQVLWDAIHAFFNGQSNMDLSNDLRTRYLECFSHAKHEYKLLEIFENESSDG